MIDKNRMNELIKTRQDIFVLYWFCLNNELCLIKYNLNSDFHVLKDKLYYKDRCINDLNMCFENIDLKVQKMNGVLEKCVIFYEYDGLEEEL